MSAFLILGLLGLVGVLSLSSDEDMETTAPQQLTGTPDQDDLLIGGEGNDTLTGNFGEADVLEGRGGDDLLILQNDNTGTGGLGQDVFDVTDGDKAVITDFNAEEDALQVLFFDSPAGTPSTEQLRWYITPEGVELHALESSDVALSEATHLVTLLGLSEPPNDSALFLLRT